MLGKGEFDRAVGEDGVEVWVTQMGPYANMNTAFIDREAGVVAIVDPFDAKGWLSALADEGLKPTHILLPHTHRDHTTGVAAPYTHLRAHEPSLHLVCRLLLEKKKQTNREPTDQY